MPGNRGTGWGCWAGELGVEVLKARRAVPLLAQLGKTQTGVGTGVGKPTEE